MSFGREFDQSLVASGFALCESYEWHKDINKNINRISVRFQAFDRVRICSFHSPENPFGRVTPHIGQNLKV